MHTATRIDSVKTSSKRVVQKTAEATGDLTGNKIVQKITLAGKTKRKEKRWKARNLDPTRKKAANYWWLKIVLTPNKNGVLKNYKFVRYCI